jgi:pimeloyl-ACP methyl ester carboxylesterase
MADAPRSGLVRSEDGADVAYDVAGAGSPPLVLVHGWSCDRGYWDAQVEPLSRRFEVVTVDLAGHGESGIGRREEWTIAAFGADVAAVVEHLGLDDVVLVGHSMGGDVVVEAARRLPGRVRGLVWADTYRQLPVNRTPEQVRDRVAPFRADFVPTAREFVRAMFHPNADQALVERVVADMSAAPPEVALAALECSWNYVREVAAGLRELALPVVAINPDGGSTDVESMQRHGVEVVFMPGVDHFPMMEDARRFNELLEQAIEGLVRRGRYTSWASTRRS